MLIIKINLSTFIVDKKAGKVGNAMLYSIAIE